MSEFHALTCVAVLPKFLSPPKGEQCFTFRTVTVLTILAVHAGSWPPVWLWWLSCSTSVSGRESRPLERWEAVQPLHEIHFHSLGRISRQVKFVWQQKQAFSVALQGLFWSQLCARDFAHRDVYRKWDSGLGFFFPLRVWTLCDCSRLCGSQPQCPMWSWLCCWSAESPCLEPSMALRPTCLWTSGDSAKPRWDQTAAMGEGKTVQST